MPSAGWGRPSLRSCLPTSLRIGRAAAITGGGSWISGVFPSNGTRNLPAWPGVWLAVLLAVHARGHGQFDPVYLDLQQHRAEHTVGHPVSLHGELHRRAVRALAESGALFFPSHCLGNCCRCNRLGARTLTRPSRKLDTVPTTASA